METLEVVSERKCTVICMGLDVWYELKNIVKIDIPLQGPHDTAMWSFSCPFTSCTVIVIASFVVIYFAREVDKKTHLACREGDTIVWCKSLALLNAGLTSH